MRFSLHETAARESVTLKLTALTRQTNFSSRGERLRDYVHTITWPSACINFSNRRRAHRDFLGIPLRQVTTQAIFFQSVRAQIFDVRAMFVFKQTGNLAHSRVFL
jgi:hypothetical protein